MKIKKLTKNQKKLLECQRKPFKGDAPINKKSKKRKSCEIFNKNPLNLNNKKIRDHFESCGKLQFKKCKKENKGVARPLGDKKVSITLKKKNKNKVYNKPIQKIDIYK